VDITAHPDKRAEINPVLGKHPSREKVNIYMGVGALAHMGVSHLLVTVWPKAVPYWEYVTIGGTLACDVNNLSLGLRVRW